MACVTAYYAVERPGEQTSVLITVNGVDALHEARRGGQVLSVRPISHEEARAIKAAREGPEAQPQPEPAPLAAPDDLRGLLTALVEELERDRQRVAQQIDELQRDHASLRETVRQIIQHSMITKVEAA